MTQFLDFVAVGVRLRGIAKIAEMLILWLRASIVCWARVSGILKAAEGDDFVVKKRSLANHRWTPCWKWVSMGVRPHSLGKPIEWKLQNRL